MVINYKKLKLMRKMEEIKERSMTRIIVLRQKLNCHSSKQNASSQNNAPRITHLKLQVKRNFHNRPK